MKKITGLLFISLAIVLQGHTQFGRPSPADRLRRDSMNALTVNAKQVAIEGHSLLPPGPYMKR
jgi:hypothetical protein